MLLTRALLRAASRQPRHRHPAKVFCVASPSLERGAASSVGTSLPPLPAFMASWATSLFEALPTATRVSYASAQGLRFAYFLTQAVLNSTLVLKVNLDVRAVATAVARALLPPTGVAPALGLTGLTTRDLLGRQLSEEEAQRVSLFWDENINAILSLYRAELEHLEAGSYKMPYDLTPSLRGPGSEQWDPLNVVAMARRYMSDQERVAARRKAPATGGVEVQQELSAEERSRYPEYYLQNFHFQSGGWLSKESAELYDYQVETLFLGSSDAMRRQVLPFMTAWARQAGGPDGEGLSLLDAACGTGRLLSFVKDNLPAMRCTAVDLSPAYLDEARRTLAPWTGDGSRLTFLNGNVEGPLPGMADASLDAVLCVYLFHELPASARIAAAAEFARLLKPGGRLFFADSAQEGDGSSNGMATANDRALSGFPRYNHEPYYEEYTKTDLAALFGGAGLVLREQKVGWLTKVMVFERAAEPAAAELETPAQAAEPIEAALA